jgi:hypothetical protein
MDHLYPWVDFSPSHYLMYFARLQFPRSMFTHRVALGANTICMHPHLYSVFVRPHPLSPRISFLHIPLLSFCFYILVYVLSTQVYYLPLLSFLRTIGLHLSPLPPATKMAKLIRTMYQAQYTLYVYIHYVYTLGIPSI